MNLILVHIGKILPPYFWDCCQQIRRFYNGSLHCILPDSVVCSDTVRDFNIHPYPYEAIEKESIYREFQQKCFLDGFWNVTMARFVMIEILMRKKSLKNVIHIENDVLIYNNPENLLKNFLAISGESVLLTPIGDRYGSGAYCFINDCTVLSKLNFLFRDYMAKGLSYLQRTIQSDINEMTLISYFTRVYHNVITYLPIMPYGKGSRYLTVFGSLFDGASAGQFIGGTNSDGPGWAGEHHWLGAELRRGGISFKWINDSKNRKIPYLCWNNKKWKLNNLHIHCKKLLDFQS